MTVRDTGRIWRQQERKDYLEWSWVRWGDARFMEMRVRRPQEGTFNGWSKKGRILCPPGHGSSSTAPPQEPHLLHGSLVPCSLLAGQSWSAHSWQYGLLTISLSLCTTDKCNALTYFKCPLPLARKNPEGRDTYWNLLFMVHPKHLSSLASPWWAAGK